MLRRRRLPVAASSLLLCGSLVLSACGGGSADGDATDGTATGTSSTSTSGAGKTESASTSGTDDASPSTPEAEETTEDPYEIDCNRVSQEAVDEWTRGGEPASVEETEDGCRIVSSSQAGAVIVEWRWLDVIGSGSDAALLREDRDTSTTITVTEGIAGIRSESDVAPTRKSRVIAWIGAQTMLIESTATLDRSQDLRDMRRMARQIAQTYTGER